jgi:hypothetical protein
MFFSQRRRFHAADADPLLRLPFFAIAFHAAAADY